MATPSNSTVSDVKAQFFPFLSLHVELRQMIYHEFFSRRSIILREKLDPPGTYMCGRRYWHFYLDDTFSTDDDVIPLLQTSRQILAEAQPILRRYTPTCLVLSKNLRRQPSDIFKEELTNNALPYQHITCLILNVKCLGMNSKYRNCPGPRTDEPDNVIVFNDDQDWDWDANDEPPPDPKRHPDLDGLYQLSQFFSSLPALRELHIYDVLKHFLSHPSDPCPCPIKGTSTCTCGECKCVCVICPSLPNSPIASIADTREAIYEVLLARFRDALPKPQTEGYPRRISNHFAVLETLAYGVHIFLHEEIHLPTPVEQRKSIYKGLWRAKYHLAPPNIAKAPAIVSTEIAETPRQRRLRREVEEEEKLRLREEQGPGPGPEFFDLNRDFDLISKWLADDSHRVVSEVLIGKALIEFEAGLNLELVNELDFDTILEDSLLDEHRVTMEAKYGKFWQWD